MAVTRSKSYVYLIGEPVDQFDGRFLPTCREVLRVYFFYHKVSKYSQKDAVREVLTEVCEIWARARVPTADLRNIIPKLENLIKTYRNICRNKGRQGPAQITKEKDFESSISQLFDIAHHQAMELIRNDEDRVFLVDQRTTRKMCMGKVDKELTEKEERTEKRFQNEKERWAKEEQRKQDEGATCGSTAGVLQFSDSDDNDVHISSQSSEDDFKAGCSHRSDTPGVPEKRRRAKISSTIPVSAELAGALDRTNVSSRKAAFILHAAAKSYGQDLSATPLSASSIHRSRSQHRHEAAGRAKAEFLDTGPLVIHFDGKLLPAIAGGPEKEDRVAIVVSGHKIEKLIAIPKVSHGTGEAVAKAASESVLEWNLGDQIVAMSFDTTAANTGHKNGACTLIEQKLGKNLLWLPCRHHVHEVLCGDVFKKTFGPTSGPSVELFRRFQEYWPNIDQAAYQPCNDSRLCGDHLSALKSESVTFCINVLTAETGCIPREDYMELLELTLIFLGEVPPRGVRFRAPGAFHHARWMSKLLYVLKLNLFQDQFQLTKHESSSCLEFGLFVALIYCKAWTTCAFPADAPNNDLCLIRALTNYKTTSDAISTAGLRAVERHLWYLGQELTPLALFSDNVSPEVKQKIVYRLKQFETQANTEERSVRYSGKEDLSDKTLDYFVGPSSFLFFRVLQINKAFLECEIQSWTDEPSYKEAKTTVESLRVVNDAAERGIALATTFNASLSKREEEKQLVYQMVDMHRKLLPKPTKSAALGNKTD